MTDGGLGIAFFAPFDNERYFFPWRPIAVSPISVTAFFSERGLAVIRSEILWIWIPCLLLVSIRLPVRLFSRRDAHREEAGG
jgi:inner membrane protein